MPRAVDDNKYHPPIALMTRVDVTGLTGVEALARGSNVTLASTERFGDAITFANNRNRRTGRSLQEELTAAGTGGGTWSISLDASTDLLIIDNDTESFNLTAHADNEAFGFPAAGATAVNIAGSLHRLIATNPWRRGAVISKHLELDPAGAGAAFYLPALPYVAQSIPCLLRAAGLGDADDEAAGNSLAEQDCDANDNASRRIEWVITDDGKLASGWDDAAGIADPAFTSAGAALRRYCGWTGNEAGEDIAVRAGTLRYIEGQHPMSGVLCPGEPLETFVRLTDLTGASVRNRDGSSSYVDEGSHGGWRLSFYIPGPVDAQQRDLVRHWLDHCLPYGHPGAPWTLYQDWGETRRALAVRDLTTTQDAYDLVYTSERLHSHTYGGERGRLLLYLDPDSPRRIEGEWGGPVQQDVRVQLTFNDRSE